jgi:hypothetical protein
MATRNPMGWGSELVIGNERKAYLEPPDVPGDGGVPELHLVQRGHGEGGGEQDAAHDPDEEEEQEAPSISAARSIKAA